MTNSDVDRLDEAAVTAASGAYAPHSQFRVGAAVLDADGTITIGANVESASYGLTCCAERVALFAAYSARRRQPVAISVACPDGDPDNPETVMPCGACRQVIAELAPQATISVVGVGRFTVAELLPLRFRI